MRGRQRSAFRWRQAQFCFPQESVPVNTRRFAKYPIVEDGIMRRSPVRVRPPSPRDDCTASCTPPFPGKGRSGRGHRARQDISTRIFFLKQFITNQYKYIPAFDYSTAATKYSPADVKYSSVARDVCTVAHTVARGDSWQQPVIRDNDGGYLTIRLAVNNKKE